MMMLTSIWVMINLMAIMMMMMTMMNHQVVAKTIMEDDYKQS